MITTNLSFAMPSSASRHHLLCTALMLGACVDAADLGDVPGETEAMGGTQGSATNGGTEAPGTQGPDTDGAEATDGTEATDGDATGGQESVGGCERVSGGEGDAYQWALICGTPSSERLRLLGLTPSGDVLVGIETRAFSDDEVLPTWEVGGVEYEHQGQSDLLLMRLDSGGELIWSRYFGTQEDIWAAEVSACGEGFVVTGAVSSVPLEVEGGVLQGESFIARFDAEGALVWTRQINAVDADGGANVLDVDCDAAGNIAVVGGSRGSIDFGLGAMPGAVSDGFVAKFDPSGEPLFAELLAGFTNSEARARAVVAHDDGGTYVFADHLGPVEVGAVSIEGTNGSPAGLLVRLSAAGELDWFAQFPGAADVYSGDLAVDDDGRAVVAGAFLATVEVGGETYESVDVEFEGNETRYDAFVAAYEADGAFAWGHQLGWIGDEVAALGRFDGDRALVHRVSGGRISLNEYGPKGAEELLGVELEGSDSGYQYPAIRAGAGATVLGAAVSGSTLWPLDLSGLAYGGGDVLIARLRLGDAAR